MTQLHSGSGWQLDEAARAQAVAEYDLEGLRGSDALRRITDFASALCEAPVALVSIVEQYRQTFIARTGFDAPEPPRESSFCVHAMVEDGVMEVPDATRDSRFVDNDLVTGEMGIRFYAGAPLVSAEGAPLGSLCVIDTVARGGLTPLQRQGLEVLAEAVMTRLQASREAALA